MSYIVYSESTPMLLPLRLTFRHFEPSPALEARARELVDRLGRYQRVSSCHLTIEASTGDHDKGMPYTVKIELTIPGAQIHADSHRGDQATHSDVYVALSDALENAKRQLQELHREHRHSARVPEH